MGIPLLNRRRWSSAPRGPVRANGRILNRSANSILTEPIGASLSLARNRRKLEFGGAESGSRQPTLGPSTKLERQLSPWGEPSPRAPVAVTDVMKKAPVSCRYGNQDRNRRTEVYPCGTDYYFFTHSHNEPLNAFWPFGVFMLAFESLYAHQFESPCEH